MLRYKSIPYYGKTSIAGLHAHFQRLLPLGPTIIYNVVARTAQDLQPELIEELAGHANFLGIKECLVINGSPITNPKVLLVGPEMTISVLLVVINITLMA